MAKQIEGVYEKVLECAKIEFLEKGFKDASLRTIAQNAGTSTGSIYTRFVDKNGLFEALVSSFAEGLKEIYLSAQVDFSRLPGGEQRETVFDYSTDKFQDFISYIYHHFDEAKLLITCSEGTTFANFVHSLVELDVEYTKKFIEAIGSDALTSGRATPEFLHIISSAVFSGVFEIVVHDMTRQAAEQYISRLRRFFQAGWDTILNP
ncbi:TetR/AcrR family transcriptional regulator [Ruminiclostridium cellobioparum]|uniref:Transcriptional regulator n=1 Tax=Ruminiclostridium cellobioparum subsp. termitidis CT1112 TaxID=1195236 RepID=S0FHJ8_RUMCE|nr:TetR/AcrR family transcriptional regulator [Ruminiclostridium cellobioparum]EMS69361.1 Transcriptional regulator [Ruminiclostridium cellobioparum subsp. termitidis CT1112]